MESLRPSSPRLKGMAPYDPKYLPAEAVLSANENPRDRAPGLREDIAQRLEVLSFNRYPDPLANDLRDQIATANGLDRCEVLVGNGGDELLFNLALAWGGPGRKTLDIPPTFSVYAQNATLTGTEVVKVKRKPDFSIDEEAVLSRLAQGDIDYLIITSPNNPTGDLADQRFIERVLEATDALVLVDEAYGEFAGESMLFRLKDHKNLAILRTFSKAYGLAGVRLGYLLAHAEVVEEFIKVRQPYSVDALSQVIGSCVFEHRNEFANEIAHTIEQRELLFKALSDIADVQVFPSSANYLLFKVDDAGEVWRALYEKGVLIRDFSSAEDLKDCLRVTVGTSEENTLFLGVLEQVLKSRKTDAAK